MMISDKELIADTETAALLQQYPAWTLDSHILQRKWAFKHFRAGFAFLTEAAMLFEKHNHHGDVALTYRHVSIRLTSHDVGGLTQRDVRMVAALERIHA